MTHCNLLGHWSSFRKTLHQANWLVKSGMAGRGQVVEKFHLPSAGDHRSHCSTGDAADLDIMGTSL